MLFKIWYLQIAYVMKRFLLPSNASVIILAAHYYEFERVSFTVFQFNYTLRKVGLNVLVPIRNATTIQSHIRKTGELKDRN